MFVLYLNQPLDEARQAFDGTLVTHMEYYQKLAASPVSQPYFLGFIMISISFRFFFSLKATRVFGPFTKLIKINAVSLLPWLLVTVILLLFSSSSLYVLLSEQPASCSSLYSCMKVLIEGAVGAVRFQHLGSEWAGFFFFGSVTLILAAVLMNMVIAKINSSYKEVSRKGTLHYYKDLLDLRYLYKLDFNYGYLVALEHPFSILLLSSLCFLRSVERRSRRQREEELTQALLNSS